ncbi:MAG: hypothetical protein LBI03_04035 [Clostridiales bacterium]|nr:hypothetical protein [Clostridiales bacterium]
MKNIFNKIFDRDTTYIIVAIIFGIAVWLFVLDTANPQQVKSIDVPITIENESTPNDTSLKNTTVDYPKVVNVKVSGREETINKLVNSDLYASVDFASINQTGQAPLKVNVSCGLSGIKINDYSPKEIDFSFDREIVRNLDVKIDFDNSLLKKDYRLLSITAEPDSMPAIGFETDVNELESLRVDMTDNVEEGSIDRDKTMSFFGKFYNNNGQDMSHIFDAVRINIRVEVAKEVPLIYTISGQPASEYYVDSSTITADKVLIRGNPDELDDIDSINFGTVNVENAVSDVIVTNNITPLLQQGLSIVGDDNVTVAVSIKTYITKNFVIDDTILSKAGLDADKNIYIISPQSYVITVKGKEKDLNELQRISLNPTIDLTGKEPGIYRIPLTVELPPEITLIGEYMYDVTIISGNTSVTPTPTITPDTPATPFESTPTYVPTPE